MPRKKLDDGDKKRIEIRFDQVKHADVINFLENETDSMAGFIKNLVINYVRSQQTVSVIANPVSPTPSVDTNLNKIEEQKEQPKKRRLNLHNNVIKGQDVTDNENSDSL